MLRLKVKNNEFTLQSLRFRVLGLREGLRVKG
jgi:hypothetical protein